MRYISTTDTNITFTDTNGKVMVVPKNRVYTHFNVDTVTFLLIERYDNEGICIFTTIAEDLQINGKTYTYEQLLDGDGISDLFSPTGSLSYKIVDELPQTGTSGVIYLVPKGENSYTEYLWIEDEERYEMLGDVGDIDLTDYYTKTEVDDKLVLKANASEVYTKTEADNKFLTEHQSLSNYYTKDDVYNKTESDAKYATQVVVNEEIAARIEAIRDINTTLGTKADKSEIPVVPDMTNYYSKTETDALLADKADTDDIPTDNAELTNGAGYITNSALNGYATEQWVENQGYLTEHQSLANYYTKTETDALIPNVEDYFDGAEYDSNTRRINFKHGNTIKAYIDANAFIKDGMVENVEISNGNLVITFNTDAGKQPISIPLTDIFNPANYYDKTTADSTFATQVVVNQEIAARIQGDADINTALGTKADKSDTYTKTEVDTALALKQDASTAFSGDYNDLTNKPDLSVYAESADLATVATSGSYDDLSNKPTIPTVPTNVSAFTNDAGYLTEHQSLDNYYTKSEVDAELDTKQDISDAFSGDYNDLTNKPTIPTVPTNVSAFTNDAGYLTQHQSLANYYTKDETDALIPDTSDFLTKSEFDTKEEVISTALNELEDGKQDKLTAGSNITIDANNVISSTGGTQQQADWNQTDTTAVDYIKNKPNTSDFVTKAEYNPKEVAIAEALIDLKENKADKTELNAKQDALISGTNIKTINNQSILGEGNIEIQGGGGGDMSNYYTKAEIDAMVGNINTILASI